MARKKIIKDKMVLKEEFWPREEKILSKQPRKNQVVDEEYFPDLICANFYEVREE